MKIRVLRHAVIQPQDQSIKLIPLTRGQNAIVDVEDYDWLMASNWNAQFKRGLWYGASSKYGLMHRAIMARYADINDLLIDHKDCDGLNNRKVNLRTASHTQNQQNTRLYRRNKCGLKGVRFCPNRTLSFRAEITVQGKQIHLGHFRSSFEAHLAYRRAGMFYFGEFFREK